MAQINFDRQTTPNFLATNKSGIYTESENHDFSSGGESLQERLYRYKAAKANSDLKGKMLDSAKATRKRYSQSDDVYFVDNYKAKKKKSSSAGQTSSGRGLHFYFSLVSWCLMLCVFGRLLFVERGVVDFWKKERFLNGKVKELNAVIKENKSLIAEISRIQQDRGFQKSLVRKNLGFIDSDEYLVLFATAGD